MKVGDTIHFKSLMYDLFPVGACQGVLRMVDGEDMVVGTDRGLVAVSRCNLISAEDFERIGFLRDVEAVKSFICAESVPDLPEVRALAKAIREQKA